jgi:sec-independent protein translocase protein TatC
MNNLSACQSGHEHRAMALLEALRRVLIRVVIVTGVLAVGGYYCAEPFLLYLKRITGVELVFYGLPDAFFSFLKLSLGIGLAGGMPYALYVVLAIFPPHFPNFSRKVLLGFWIASVLLFALGVIFCLFISLPYGIQFLLSYENSNVAAVISVKSFVSFCLLLLFGLGLVFELPLAMMLLARLGIVDRKKLSGYRRYAILAIVVVAAIVTPTSDIVNLLLMAVPLYLLFEMGLLGMGLW